MADKHANPPIHRRRRKKVRPGDVGRVIVLVLYVLVVIAPIYWMFITSVKSYGEIVNVEKITYVPENFTWENYEQLFDSVDFGVYLSNSLQYALLTASIVVIITVLSGYGMSRYQFKFKGVLLGFWMVAQMIPGILCTIPMYVIYSKLGLINTKPGLFFIFVTGQIPFCTITMRAFFDRIPVSLEEAAFVDGCEALGVNLSKETLSSLVGIHRKRYSNARSSRQTTRLVVSETAMRRFAETGCMSDHMYAMRAFTPEERIGILNDCIRQMESGHASGLHIHLLNREDEERIYANEHPIEMVCYDGSCVQLTPAMTDYNFQKGHSEIFIGQEMFRGLFVEFFMNDLIQYHTLPEKASAELFRELVQELETRV